MPEQNTSKTKVIKEFFGYKEGQGLREFAEEFKALSEQDKAQLAEGITNGTLTY